ncbi:MAG: hypothetical protein QOH61_591 [Chloroflexota bacterium]|jgi:hypothetical protein|nr:hypothetical protein [Chloroflexota bacterium]
MPKLPRLDSKPAIHKPPVVAAPKPDDACCNKLLEALGGLRDIEQRELEMLAGIRETLGSRLDTHAIAMCDCGGERRKDETCVPFLRIFTVEPNSGRILGFVDHSYDGHRYEPVGRPRPDANCCDCHSDGRRETSLVSYDLCCLFRERELNGGLANFEIAPDGPALTFSPPLNDAHALAARLNADHYLGYDSWAADDCRLTVTIPSGTTPPGPATGCRFRRFVGNVSMAVLDDVGGPPLNWINYTDLVDKMAFDAPDRKSDSSIHYWNTLEGLVGGVLTNLTGNRGPWHANAYDSDNDLFRSGFRRDSKGNVPLELRDTSQQLQYANTPAARESWARQFADWMQDRLGSGYLVHALSYTGTNHSPHFTYNHYQMTIDTPCDVELTRFHLSAYVLSEMKVAHLWSVTPGNFDGAATAGSHIATFEVQPGIGDYTSEPAIDGQGGSIDWPDDCSIPEPVMAEGSRTSTPTRVAPLV